MKIESVLSAKGSSVSTVRPDIQIDLAVKKMKAANIGALVVTDAYGRVLGMLSERDILHALAMHGADALGLRVRDLMTSPAIGCEPDTSVREAMRTMTQRRVRHLPVVEQGRLIGLVSIGDLVKSRLEETELEARVLREAYIASH